VRAFVDQIVNHYGGLDVCFNNAGITVQKPLHEHTDQEWDDVVNTDLRGNFLALKYEIPHLLNRGGGLVVVTSSAVAISAGAGQSAYSARKPGFSAWSTPRRSTTRKPGPGSTHSCPEPRFVRRVAGQHEPTQGGLQGSVQRPSSGTRPGHGTLQLQIRIN
jgi:NAD(P)-dependent dehydrogenase (short-subunit alcohol dehydrogenase family)